MKGKMKHRVCNSSKEGAAESVASGKWPRSTTPPRRGWQSLQWSGVTKNYARVVEGATSQSLTWGVLLGVITCVGVCRFHLLFIPSSGICALINLSISKSGWSGGPGSITRRHRFRRSLLACETASVIHLAQNNQALSC